jgi:D-alanine--poly(phosphoribitol) ligase subunit 2
MKNFYRRLILDTKEKIRNFILKELCLDESIKILADDEELIENGIVDSMGILNLLAFLEENYGVLLAEGELDRNNLATIQKICNLVSQNMPSN